MREIRVLFEDENMIVCVKPHGVLSQSGSGANMPGLLAELTGSAVYPVHRLDRETAGVMVYAKTREEAGRLSALVSGGKMKKIYYAAVKDGPAEDKGEWTDLLFRDRNKNKSYVVKRMIKGVKEARLAYEVIARREGIALCRVRLFTGRTHQIRVQFASRGFPLTGDSRYAGGKGELALYAYSLTFETADGEERTFECLPDKSVYPFDLFGDLL